MDDANELLDIAGAAAFLSVSETSLRRWTNAGKLSCLRVGLKRERRFRRDDLLAFMEDEPQLGASVARTPVREALSHSERLSAKSGAHLCGVYETHLGLITLAVPFILGGLEEESICFVIASPRARPDLLKFLKEKRKSLQSDIKARRLVFALYRDSGDEQCDYFREQFEKATKTRASSFRVLGDVRALRRKTTSKDVLHYEACYDRRIARRYPVTTLCSYDARRFDGIELLNAFKGHPDTLRYPLEDALA
ncbi:MAG: MEDS domain-containing protein [Gemmatimonadaceae bacterium]